jgi:lipopolysaccharide transport system permease protein
VSSPIGPQPVSLLESSALGRAARKLVLPLRNRENPIGLIALYRSVLWRTTFSEVRQRYAGSAIGLFWVVLAPALLLTLYACVFIYIYKTTPQGLDTTSYLIQLFAGLLPFLGFSDGLMSGANAVISNRAVLLNTVYPAELVGLRAVLTGHAVSALGLVLVIALTLLAGRGSPGLVLLPAVLVLQVMFVAGIAWPLSLAGLVLRDTQQILSFVCTALMIVSPIAFAPGAAPGALKLLIYLNPLSYYILTFQSLAMTGGLPSTKIVVIMLVLSLGAFFFGFRLFQRGKLAFWDHA